MQDPTIPNNQQPNAQIPTGMPPVTGMSQPVSTPAPVAPLTGQTPSIQSPQPQQPEKVAQAPVVKPAEKPEVKREASKNGEPEVKKVDIEKIVSSWTGIPITKLTEDEGAKLLNLEKRIHQRLIDQEEAVTAVAEAVRRGRIGLAAANRPIASFIFLGPSGTGKTELAKTLAEILFGKDDALVRLDMSEYMEKHEVAKLIGAPPGYVGYEEGGQLTEAVRAKPYSIVLLDEVEKAHPDVFNILLQLLEDGRLTDNKGNTISFKNTIVICTSNIGSALITQKLGEKEGKELTEVEFVKEFGELTTLVNGELRKFFRPELLNRFDDIVIFKPLRRQDMKAIARLGIQKTNKLLQEQDIKLTMSDKALSQLALEGYDPIYGARPLRRLIQTSIENPIAVLIIAKTFVAGDTIMIDYDQAKSDYSFRKATPQDIARLSSPEGEANGGQAAVEKQAEEDKKQKENPTPSLGDAKQLNNPTNNNQNKQFPSGNTPPAAQVVNSPTTPSIQNNSVNTNSRPVPPISSGSPQTPVVDTPK